MVVELALFIQLAEKCAPTVAPETLAGIARTESGFNPYAILDNDMRRSYSPSTLDEAQAIASQLIASGHSVDVGLMQVNNRNFPSLGLTVGKALDSCSSLSAGARVLAEAYSGGATEPEQQLAVRVALSRYNTGNAARGFANGYVRKVGLLILATQQPEHVLDSPLGASLVAQCQTKILFPSPTADADAYVQGLKCTEGEFRQVRTEMSVGVRRFLLKREAGSVVCEFDLSGMRDLLAVLSGRANTVELGARIRAELGSDPAVWVPAFRSRYQEAKD